MNYYIEACNLYTTHQPVKGIVTAQPVEYCMVYSPIAISDSYFSSVQLCAETTVYFTEYTYQSNQSEVNIYE